MNLDELRELAAAGLSDAAIADRVGKSSRTVLRWRVRHGIASSWAPELAPCGTESAYHRGCRCAPCRAANSGATRRRRQLGNRLTPAPRSGEPWTPAEDLELVEGTGTLLERARRLGRSYVAAEQRIRELRHPRRQEEAAATL